MGSALSPLLSCQQKVRNGHCECFPKENQAMMQGKVEPKRLGQRFLKEVSLHRRERLHNN